MAVTATDQTVQVSKGAKLDVNNFAGDVLIKVWDRDAVRVEVTHSDRESVDIKQADQIVIVRSRSARGGPPRSLDYNITVPSWMGDQRQRELRLRDDGRRRRRRQRRDHPRRHQRARRLGVRVAEVGAGGGDASKRPRGGLRCARSTRASAWPTSTATCRPSRPTAASSSTASTRGTSTSTPSTATSPTTGRSRKRASTG